MPVFVMPVLRFLRPSRKKSYFVFLNRRGRHFKPSFVSHLSRSRSLQKVNLSNRPLGEKGLSLVFQILKIIGLLLLITGLLLFVWWSCQGLKIFN